MITNKRFDDPSYNEWVLPETCNDINGTPLERHYDTSKTKSELLASGISFLSASLKNQSTIATY